MEHARETCSGPPLASRRPTPRGLFAAWLTGVLIAGFLEAQRLRLKLIQDATPGEWWDRPALDGTFLFPLLLFAPFCWIYVVPNSPPPFLGRGPDGGWKAWLSRTPFSSQFPATPRTWPHPAYLALGVGLLSLFVSWSTSQRPVRGSGSTLAALLPTMHDEFSYELQARTFLAGRRHWPGPEAAREIFHQTHVLNEGRFASRYFPGTGLWLAAWVALGQPVWGQWVAGAIVAAGFCLLGCELFGRSAGLLTGVLIALAPGSALLNNMLVAHQSTLLGLTLFLCAFQRWTNTRCRGWAWLAGTGLAWAMISRPLTAAAVGLPFGAWWLAQCVRRDAGSRTAWMRSVPGLATPIVAGLLLVAWQNVAITGDPWMTPYSQYTALYTPRHVYGFHNGDAAAVAPEKVLREYNNWAANLDAARAATNVLSRLWNSWCWSLGGVPLAMIAVLSLSYATLAFKDQESPIRQSGANSRQTASSDGPDANAFRLRWGAFPCLLLTSIVSLHVAHVPYWLDGLLGYHYVYESGPLWLLLTGGLISQLCRVARAERRLLFPVWCGLLLGVSIASNHVELGVNGQSRVDLGAQLITQPGASAVKFFRRLRRANLPRPALILVRSHPEDLHAEFVRNDPRFECDVLIGRDRPDLYSHDDLRKLFPDRALYLYDTRVGEFVPIVPPHANHPSEATP